MYSTVGSIDCSIHGYDILDFKFYTALMTNMTQQAQTQRLSVYTGGKKSAGVKGFVSDKCGILGMAQVLYVH
jgi:hypothetical protein